MPAVDYVMLLRKTQGVDRRTVCEVVGATDSDAFMLLRPIGTSKVLKVSVAAFCRVMY
ncbi:MAG: hypothetical protein RIR91_345 [Verrucomicrobiota bacterium]|jgi:hypothetical protein